MIDHLSIKDKVRELIIKHGHRDTDDNQLIIDYWRRYNNLPLQTAWINPSNLTPAESITRARRSLVNEAKRYERLHGERSWTLALIPSGERLISARAASLGYREAYS